MDGCWDGWLPPSLLGEARPIGRQRYPDRRAKLSTGQGAQGHIAQRLERTVHIREVCGSNPHVPIDAGPPRSEPQVLLRGSNH